MPFTPAHTSVVLPLLRLRPQLVSATALVIGSVAPDFEYFLKMSVSSVYSHTLLGILYFNIPITIVLAFLFHGVVKRNLIANLPVFFQYRFHDLLTLDFKKYFKSYFWIVIVSAGIGSFSHLFWDAFTHNDGYFAQRISLYKHVVIPFDGVRYPLFYGLQHISTVMGIIILAVYTVMIKPQKIHLIKKPGLTYWLLILTISVFILFFRFAISPDELDLGNFVVSFISSLLVALIIAGFVKFKN